MIVTVTCAVLPCACEGEVSADMCVVVCYLLFLMPSQARSYTQQGSRSRGFARWLSRTGLLQPSYVEVLMKTSRHDATPMMVNVAVMNPMKLALLLRDHRPDLLFVSHDQQADFASKSGP